MNIVVNTKFNSYFLLRTCLCFGLFNILDGFVYRKTTRISSLSYNEISKVLRQPRLLQLSGLFGEQPISERKKSRKMDWDIYIDQSKASLDKGGGATLDAFCGLVPSSSNVNIIPAILPKSNKKGPWIRCISNIPGRNSIDVNNVDSVDKVYRVLTKHLKINKVSMDACECLKWKYKGNSYLEAGKISLALDAYNKALGKCKDDKKQEGVILLLRASAYLQQAKSHKEILQSIVQEWEVPDAQDVQTLALAASAGGPKQGGFANSILQKLNNNGIRQQAELRKIQYRHGLYQYSLLHAAQDSLRSTELLPQYSTAWLRAGELLSELWKLKESRQYYEKALSLDESLKDSLKDVMKGLQRRQELLERVRARRDWPEDSLRLALDIAA